MSARIGFAAVLVALLACGVLESGCGGTSCKDSCEATNKCGESNYGDCGTYCDKLDQVNKDSGCEDLYNKLLDCVDNQKDICTAYRSGCTAELKAYDDCENPYCAAHPGTCPGR